MIETTVAEVDGVKFLKDIRILEPDDTIGGMGVHRIDRFIAAAYPRFIGAVKALGLRKVGEDVCCDADLYAQFPIPFLPTKLVQAGLKVYWAIIRWLYDNARMFKQIPPGTMFSWTYFTPYTWLKGVKCLSGKNTQRHRE